MPELSESARNPGVKIKTMGNKKLWEIKSHSSQIADTGDYDGYYELTNGTVSLFSKDDIDTDDPDHSSINTVVSILNDLNYKWYMDDSEKFLLHLKEQEVSRLLKFLEDKGLFDEYNTSLAPTDSELMFD